MASLAYCFCFFGSLRLSLNPVFEGNRSPLNDPNMTGSICGLTLNESVEYLAVVYLSALQALAFQTKQIVERLMSACHSPFKLIVIIGGLAKNDFYTQTHSDICGIPVCVPDDAESVVLLGACISGAFRTHDFANQSFDSVLRRLSGSATSVKLLYPNINESITHYYEKKFKVFLAMLEDQLKYNSIMAN
jgi:ribulose kinase